MDAKSEQAETAFAYDSVIVLGRGLSSLDASHNIQPANLSCDRDIPWSDGLSLLNYITAVRNHHFIHPTFYLSSKYFKAPEYYIG